MKTNFFVALILIGLMVSCKHEQEVNSPDPNAALQTDSTCNSSNVYFVNDVLPIFASSCALSGCHNASSAREGIILDSYFNIISTGEIDKGNPDNSKVFESLTASGEDRMPPTSSGITLSNAQIQTINDWIAAGAINNQCVESSCDTVNVSFSATIFPMVQNNCTGCHSGNFPSGNLILTDYTTVKASADNGGFLGAIDHQLGYQPMPQGQPKLNDCIINQVKSWINDGAPNN